MLSKEVIPTENYGDILQKNDPLEQWIVSLTMHEVGHTLGLRHNS